MCPHTARSRDSVGSGDKTSQFTTALLRLSYCFTHTNIYMCVLIQRAAATVSDLATKHVFFFQYGPASLVKHQYSLQYKSLQSSASLLCLQLSVLHMITRAASRSKARVFEKTRNVVTAICVLILRCVLILLYVFSYYYFVGAGNKARFFF